MYTAQNRFKTFWGEIGHLIRSTVTVELNPYPMTEGLQGRIVLPKFDENAEMEQMIDNPVMANGILTKAGRFVLVG